MESKEEEQQKVWQSIAASWHSFRQKPNPKIGLLIKNLASKWKPGKILDIGCGNCRNLLPFSFNYFDCYGIDFSSNMLKYAQEFIKKHRMNVNLQQASATKLPFATNSFPYILSISMLHHLNAEERHKALKEIKRVLKPRGKVLFTVWNKLQWRFLFKSSDILIPWHVKGMRYDRYYHLLTYWEFKKLIEEHGFKILEKNMFGSNLTFICQG
ncbi:class I SAM-dependent methyltransferase [Candidatus Pacearchaeota archaeon]|nr:class I SAM-dependent methyltransferase [Candidatus Pacearchaeota archaeon]